MNEYQIRKQLRKHWNWLKNTDPDEVANFVISVGNRYPGITENTSQARFIFREEENV